MTNQRFNPADFVTPTQRKRLEAAIERLLTLLDRINGDPDSEKDTDLEPDLLGPTLATPGSTLNLILAIFPSQMKTGGHCQTNAVSAARFDKHMRMADTKIMSNSLAIILDRQGVSQTS